MASEWERSSATTSEHVRVVRPPLPQRIAIPPLLAAGVAAGFVSVVMGPRGLAASILAIVFGGWLAAGCAWAAGDAAFGRVLRANTRWRKTSPARTLLMIGTLATSFGLVLGVVEGRSWESGRDVLSEAGQAHFRLRITDSSTPQPYGGGRATATIESIGTIAGVRPVAHQIEIQHADGVHFQFGQLVDLVGRVRSKDGLDLMDLGRGVVGTLRLPGSDAATVRTAWPSGPLGWLARARYEMAGKIGRLEVGERGRALLAGLLLGERGRTRAVGLDDTFRRAGISHILSVSGSHLAVVGAALIALTKGLGWGKTGGMFVALPATLAFTVMTGAESATLRAWLMLVGVASCFWGGRRFDGLAAVSTAATVLIVSEPTLTFSVGYWLSVTSVCGLVLFTRYFGRWATHVLGPSKVAQGVAVTLAATTAAQLATMPITAMVFGTMSLVAPLSNAIVVPLSSVAIVVGMVGAGARLAGVQSDVVLAVAATICEWAAEVTSVIGSIPGGELAIGPTPWRVAVAAGSVALMIGVYGWWPEPRAVSARRSSGSTLSGRGSSGGRLTALGAAALAAVVLIWLMPTVGIVDRVTVLNVGQGDATLVQSGGRSTLIDGGPDPGILRWQLWASGCFSVDRVIVTHDHEDHVAGLSVLEGQPGGPPSEVMCAVGASSSTSLRRLADSYGLGLTELPSGSTVRIGALSARVLSPSQPVTDPSANDSCLVLLVGRGGRGVLLGGDAEASATQRAVEGLDPGAVEVLKVGHHGSIGAVSESLLDDVDPTLAVISVGKGNGYGHPSADCLALLAGHGVQVRRTDFDGRVVLRF